MLYVDSNHLIVPVNVVESLVNWQLWCVDWWRECWVFSL